MGLFNLFGGRKKDNAKARPVEPKPVVETTPAAKPAPETATAASDAGVKQVKLRLKLAASLRARERAAAFEAAKSLAAIQVRAGRRVGARVWSAEAERISRSRKRRNGVRAQDTR